MKRKNKEVGKCCNCGKETTKRLSWMKSINKRIKVIKGAFYCGCKPIRV